MTQTWLGWLSVVLASPSPQPTLKTIITGAFVTVLYGVESGASARALRPDAMDPLNGTSRLSARLRTQINVVNGPGTTTVQAEQILIKQSEDMASKPIVDAAAGCTN